jgi:predicted component of type VI protein secretion system
MGRAQVIGKSLIVGTDPACGLQLTDERVSQKHLEIAPESGGWRVRDLDSTNGTHFEGSQIKEALLTAGATLKIGRSFLRVQPAPEPLEVAPSQSRRFGELVAESLAMREVFAVLELASQVAGHRAARGRDRHRKGAGRARDSRREPAAQGSFRRHRLWRAARVAARE